MSAVEKTRAAKDWEWWRTSPNVVDATIRECIHEAEALIAEETARADRAEAALATLLHYAELFREGQSVKTGERLGMAKTYARAVLGGDSDPMQRVRDEWSDLGGQLVTHFSIARHDAEVKP